MRHDITKEYLEETLINKNQPITVVMTEKNVSRIIVINRCKKYGIYDKVVSLRKSVHLVDLTNRQFGNLIVISRAKNTSKGQARWICLCTCGRHKTIVAASLVNNLSTSCGMCKKNKGYESVSGTYVKSLKESANNRNIEFNISAIDIWNKYIEQNGKCSLTGIDVKFISHMDKQRMQTASVDRIDSTKKYSYDNIRIVHKKINLMRGAMSDIEFLSWIKLLHKYNQNEIENIKELEITQTIRKYDNLHYMKS